MRLDFDPNESVVYNPGPDRYILKPVIKIAANSLVDGPFAVSGLIQDESVVAELSPDGTLKLLTTAAPHVELRGKYYFNYGTRILHLDLSEVGCSTCTGAETIPGSIFYNLPNSDVHVDTWTTTNIVGSVGSGLLSRSVAFQKTQAFTLDTSTGYTVLAVTVTYPSGYDGKFGVLSLSPQGDGGRAFVDVQKIQSTTVTFTFKIPYSQLPGGVPNGNRAYVATPIVANQLTDLKVSGSVMSVCGNIIFSATNYATTVVVADKVLNTSLNFVPIP